jgi:hypothetical protein
MFAFLVYRCYFGAARVVARWVTSPSRIGFSAMRTARP